MRPVSEPSAIWLAKQRRMEPEAWCEAPPVVRTARSVLLYVRTDRSKRWRIAPRLRLQATLFAGLVGLLLGCTATHEVSLGEDQPRLHTEPDAETPVEDESKDAAVVVDRTRRDAAPPPRAEAGQVRDRDAGPLVEPPSDAGPALCAPYGHRPFDGLPSVTPLPKPDEWDGGVPRLGEPLSPPSGLTPREFEAGVPPFCCTRTTPWFCAPP